MPSRPMHLSISSPVKPIAFPMFHCEVGERFVSEWKSETLRVLAKLSVVGSGDEACWFQGTVLATVEPKSSEVPVRVYVAADKPAKLDSSTSQDEGRCRTHR